MRDRLDAVRALLPGVTLRPVATLQDGGRALVQRVDTGDRTLVVKQFTAAGEGWVREAAALATLPDGVRAPRLVAEGADPPVLVLSDLGDGTSVAAALLGDDHDTAADALVAWAEATADLHVAARGGRAAFRAALDARQGDLPVGESTVRSELDDAVRLLDDRCGSLHVAIPRGALDELRGLAGRLGGDGPLASLTPADTCPDNNLGVDGGLALIDFEGAQWRHLAWDVAYLRVPWPTCWCAWRLPDEAADRAVGAYRTRAVTAFPGVRDESFAHDVEAATVGWVMISTAWFLDTALGSDPQLHPDRPAPTRRAMILHRLDRAARSGELPAVAEFAARLRADLVVRWGEQRLDLAPAFRR